MDEKVKIWRWCDDDKYFLHDGKRMYYRFMVPVGYRWIQCREDSFWTPELLSESASAEVIDTLPEDPEAFTSWLEWKRAQKPHAQDGVEHIDEILTRDLNQWREWAREQVKSNDILEKLEELDADKRDGALMAFIAQKCDILDGELLARLDNLIFDLQHGGENSVAEGQ